MVLGTAILCAAKWVVELSADGQLVASGGADGTVRLSETSTGRPLAILEHHTGGVWAPACARCRQSVATSASTSRV
jgi:WD40 repeat protein